LRAAGLDQSVLTYKSYEALTAMANGNASTIFIPTEAVSTLGSVGAITKMFEESKNSK
jgi:hypothetical protein